MDVYQYDQRCEERCPDGMHEAVHEAGHLVAGLCVGIPIHYAVLEVDLGGFGEVGDARVVPCDPDLATWLPKDPIGGFTFLLSALGAEVACLGHAIFGHAFKDAGDWVSGMGFPGAQETDPRVVGVLGKRFEDGLIDVIEWASQHSERVQGAAAALLKRPRGDRLYASEAVALLGVHCCGKRYPDLCE